MLAPSSAPSSESLFILPKIGSAMNFNADDGLDIEDDYLEGTLRSDVRAIVAKTIAIDFTSCDWNTKTWIDNVCSSMKKDSSDNTLAKIIKDVVLAEVERHVIFTQSSQVAENIFDDDFDNDSPLREAKDIDEDITLDDIEINDSNAYPLFDFEEEGSGNGTEDNLPGARFDVQLSATTSGMDVENDDASGTLPGKRVKIPGKLSKSRRTKKQGRESGKSVRETLTESESDENNSLVDSDVDDANIFDGADDVANAEIEAIRNIDKGPSEAEIRRRKLTEIDEDVMEERVERMKTIARNTLLHALGGRQVKDTKNKLQALKVWLNTQYRKDDEEIEAWINDTLRLASMRLVIAQGDSSAAREAVMTFTEDDCREFLDNPDDVSESSAPPSDTDSDGGEDSDSETAATATESLRVGSSKTTLESAEVEDRVCLSDSDSDGSDADESQPPREPVQHTVVPSAAQQAVGAEKKEMEKFVQKAQEREASRVAMRSRQLPAISRNAPAASSRAALKQNLYKRVMVAANENLCRQMRMSTDKLRLRTEIEEKCRVMAELLHGRLLRREQRDKLREDKEREIRRRQYRQQSGEDDEILDFDALLDMNPKMLSAPTAESDHGSDEDDDNYEDDGGDFGDVDVVDEYVGGDNHDEEQSEVAVASAAEVDEHDAHDMDEDKEVSGSVGVEVRGDAKEPVSAASLHVAAAMKTYSRSRQIQDSDSDSDEAVSGKQKKTVKFHSDAIEADGSPEEPIVASTFNVDSVKVGDGLDGTDQGEDGGDGQGADGGAENSDADDAKSDRRKQDGRKKDKNLMYRMMLLEEAKKHRKEKRKSLGGSFLELEAEEEEEEGLQAGLGDFGFGVAKGPDDDDQDDHKVTAEELSMIVDELSDDEGDEDEGLKGRLEQQRLDDKAQTRQIIAAITEGGRKQRKNGYSYDKLTSGRDEMELPHARSSSRADFEEGPEDEEDEEEMLQRGLQRVADAERRRDVSLVDSDAESNESDSVQGQDVDDDEDDDADLADLEPEARAAEEERRRRYREREILQKIHRKQFAQQTKVRRAVRRAQAQNDSQSQAQFQQLSSLDAGSSSLAVLGPEHLLPSASVALALDLSAFGQRRSSTGSVVTRTQSLPGNRSLLRPAALTDVTNVQPNAQQAGDRKRRTQLMPTKHAPHVRQRSLAGPSPAAGNQQSSGQSTTSLYRAALSDAEVQAGYGMGMALSAPAPGGLRRTTSFKADSGGSASGLFSAVTGLKRPSDSQDMTGRRSFSGAVAKRRVGTGMSSGGSAVTVAGAQFVFGMPNSNTLTGAEDSQTGGGSMWGEGSHSKTATSASGTGGFFTSLGSSGSSRGGGGGGGSGRNGDDVAAIPSASLFSKLGHKSSSSCSTTLLKRGSSLPLTAR